MSENGGRIGEVAAPHIGEGLILGHYEDKEIQARADELVPIGWCNQCVAEASDKQSKGEPAEKIHAGVTIVPLPQQISIPGAGSTVVVIPAPACLARHIKATKRSPLALGEFPGGV